MPLKVGFVGSIDEGQDPFAWSRSSLYKSLFTSRKSGAKNRFKGHISDKRLSFRIKEGSPGLPHRQHEAFLLPPAVLVDLADRILSARTPEPYSAFAGHRGPAL